MWNARNPLKHRVLKTLSTVNYYVTVKSLSAEIGRDLKDAYRFLHHYETQGILEFTESHKGLAVRITSKGRERLAYFEQERG